MLPPLPSPPLSPPPQTGAGIIQTLTNLREATAPTTTPMTSAITIHPCTADSDSLLRFGAYMALPFGVQALWYEGVGQCARVGTTKFELLSSINTRLAQWVSVYV